MTGKLWLIATVVVPSLVAWYSGTTYIFAFSLIALGVLLYTIGNILTVSYGKKRGVDGAVVIPRWVSEVTLLGMGFVPSGLTILTLLWLGLIAHHP